MRLYQSNLYEQHNLGEYTRNLFYILEDEERFRLADAIEQLEADVNEMVSEGRLKPLYLKDGKTLRKKGGNQSNLVGKDIEAIDFLKRMCHFTEYPESVMLDITSYQAETIINKLLQKVYYKDFIDWLKLYVDRDKLNPHQMRSLMDRKRDMFFTLQDEGLIDKKKKLPY